jgi:hypothetical protein
MGGKIAEFASRETLVQRVLSYGHVITAMAVQRDRDRDTRAAVKGHDAK